jgi:hypothetical protein
MRALAATARLCAGMLLLACSTPGCHRSPGREEGKAVDEHRDAGGDRPEIADVLQRHTPSLLAIPGVLGTGEGRADGAPVIVIFVARRTSELGRRLPGMLEGYPVEIRESGEVTAPPR